MADETVPGTREFRLPSLGSDMDAGTIVRWRVGVGDPVHKGDVLLDVDTEKAEIEVDVWQDGVILAILVEPGAEVPVGTPLALLAPLGSPIPPAVEPDRNMPDKAADIKEAASLVAESPAFGLVDVAAEAGSDLVTPRTVYWRGAVAKTPASASAAPPRIDAAPVTLPPTAVAPSRWHDRSRDHRSRTAGVCRSHHEGSSLRRPPNGAQRRRPRGPSVRTGRARPCTGPWVTRARRYRHGGRRTAPLASRIGGCAAAALQFRWWTLHRFGPGARLAPTR